MPGPCTVLPSAKHVPSAARESPLWKCGADRLGYPSEYAIAFPLPCCQCIRAGVPFASLGTGLEHRAVEADHRPGGDALTSVRPGGLLSAGGMTAAFAL